MSCTSPASDRTAGALMRGPNKLPHHSIRWCGRSRSCVSQQVRVQPRSSCDIQPKKVKDMAGHSAPEVLPRFILYRFCWLSACTKRMMRQEQRGQLTELCCRSPVSPCRPPCSSCSARLLSCPSHPLPGLGRGLRGCQLDASPGHLALLRSRYICHGCRALYYNASSPFHSG